MDEDLYSSEITETKDMDTDGLDSSAEAVSIDMTDSDGLDFSVAENELLEDFEEPALPSEELFLESGADAELAEDVGMEEFGEMDIEDRGPVLQRDPDEIATILENTFTQRAEILRDDLRDKGMEDGPEMEAYVADQVRTWRDEAYRTYEGRDADTAVDSSLVEDQSEPELPLNEMDTIDESALEEDTLVDTTVVEEDTTVGDYILEDSESQTEDHSQYPSGFDYSNVDWDEVYSDIEAEQTTDVLPMNVSENTSGEATDAEDVPSGFDYSNVNWQQVYSDIASEQEPETAELVDTVVETDSPVDQSTSEIDSMSDTTDSASSDVSSWLGEINPNFDAFDPESPYCNNCGSCAYAVYQRLEGSTDSCASAENIGYNSEMEALTGMEQVSMSPGEIEQRLLEAGNGAHAIIGIDRAEGPGHWFNAACIDGKVVAIDGQTGEISDWPPDYGDVVNWEMSVDKEA